MRWGEWRRHCDVAVGYYWPSDHMSCQEEDHLLWVILDYQAMTMSVAGCQEQMMSMVGEMWFNFWTTFDHGELKVWRAKSWLKGNCCIDGNGCLEKCSEEWPGDTDLISQSLSFLLLRTDIYWALTVREVFLTFGRGSTSLPYVSVAFSGNMTNLFSLLAWVKDWWCA